ncbi:dipeptidase [Aestuariivita boseongensis]|uniref:dipeptidase n=1 Tax=Aestuariivita boseongensis TaxID=1470562 RepID=UPI00068033F6|nr:dipeptidase [Aestuariivita boseongensis]
MKIFDGHNDLLTQLLRRDGIAGFDTGLPGHIDLPKLQRGGMVGGFFAIWVPSKGDLAALTAEMRKDSYDLPLPPAIDLEPAQETALIEAGYLLALQEAGHLTICTSTDQIRACADTGQIAAILHLEGCEPIDPDFAMLDRLYEMGLRSLGPVWSRPTAFGEGVPFRFPSSPDTGGGLTPLGFDLVAQCNARGIALDLSHITEAGFWDVARSSQDPLIATHSNAHAICPHSRNLTDDQLRAIGETGGIAGLNFATAMLRADGKMLPELGLDVMLAHLDHMMAKAGSDCVALGSDFDGAVVPKPIGDAGGLPRLVDAMQRHGYPAGLIEKICFENWMRVLDATWR